VAATTDNRSPLGIDSTDFVILSFLLYLYQMKKLSLLILPLLVIIILGFLVPLGSYTTIRGCPVDPTPIKRLHLILGDSLDKIRQNDVAPPPNAGCSINTKFVLYLF
jgi:hypothetical protein